MEFSLQLIPGPTSCQVITLTTPSVGKEAAGSIPVRLPEHVRTKLECSLRQLFGVDLVHTYALNCTYVSCRPTCLHGCARLGRPCFSSATRLPARYGSTVGAGKTVCPAGRKAMAGAAGRCSYPVACANWLAHPNRASRVFSLERHGFLPVFLDLALFTESQRVRGRPGNNGPHTGALRWGQADRAEIDVGCGARSVRT